jgi:hypothetical protein
LGITAFRMRTEGKISERRHLARASDPVTNRFFPPYSPLT